MRVVCVSIRMGLVDILSFLAMENTLIHLGSDPASHQMRVVPIGSSAGKVVGTFPTIGLDAMRVRTSL